MINLRILSSTIACKKHLYFHTSSPAVFTFHLLYTICWRVLNHRQWGSVCLKYLGKSRLPLDVKRIHSKIVLTISKTNRAKSGIFSIKPHSRTTEPKNALMHEKKLFWETSGWKGARNTHQWISGCCASLPSAIQVPALGIMREVRLVWAATGQIHKSHVASSFPPLLQQRSELSPAPQAALQNSHLTRTEHNLLLFHPLPHCCFPAGLH